MERLNTPMDKSARTKEYLVLTILLLSSILLFMILMENTEEPKAEPIRITLDTWPGYAYAYVAQEKGFFQKNGADVELILNRDSEASKDLFKEEKAQGMFTTLSDAIMMESEGVEQSTVFIVDYSTDGDVIMCRQEINSLTELENKTIGIEGINTFSHRFVIETLARAGVKEQDIFLEKVKAHDTLEALEIGNIDAGHTREPTKSLAIKRGYKILARAGDNPWLITDVLIFDKKTLNEKSNQITAIIKSLEQVRQYTIQNREEAIRIMAESESLSNEAMAKGIDGLRWTSLYENAQMMNSKEGALDRLIREISKFWADRGQLSKMPTRRDIIDQRFVMDAGAQNRQVGR
ncbi:MAG: ABC transporter substrate-binding protein [Nanoarchaeota archaeon]